MSIRVGVKPVGPYGQGTLTVLNRQTSFGTFGGGDAIIAIPCINICGTSGGNTIPGGSGGNGSPSGSSTTPGGNTVPGGSAKPGGGGASVVWSIRRTGADATAVPVPPSGAASKSVNIAMAAAPAKITCAARPRRHRRSAQGAESGAIPTHCVSLLAAG